MRLEHWPRLLDEYVESKKGVPFAWGTNDCVTFAADWIEAATGEAVFAAEYDDAHGAAHEIADHGGLQQAITDVLGEPLEFTLSAQRGDIGLVEIEGRLSAVVVIGAWAVGPGADGLHSVPIADEDGLPTLAVAWRV